MKRVALLALLLALVASTAGCGLVNTPGKRFRVASESYISTARMLVDLRTNKVITDDATWEQIKIANRAALVTLRAWKAGLDEGREDQAVIAAFHAALGQLIAEYNLQVLAARREEDAQWPPTPLP